jgi:predicted amidophosphoribosyltransferase
MFSEIFRPVCAGCGEDSPDGIFCADCRDSLRHLKMFCRTCGHPLNVDALTCGFCPSRRYDRLVYRLSVFIPAEGNAEKN